MKKMMRGVKQFFVMVLTTVLVAESVFMPVNGEVKKGASAQTETVEQQISDNSVKNHGEETISANFVFEKEPAVSENSVITTEREKELPREQSVLPCGGIDGALTWSIDEKGHLTVTGKGDYEESPDWILYEKDIKSAYINVQEITNMYRFFYCCRNMTEVDFADTDTSQVTDMGYMFGQCEELEELDISKFNTEKVKMMSCMFSECKKLRRLDLSSFDTSNVTTMAVMFLKCESLESLDLRNFDTSKVESMVRMFEGCTSMRSVNVSSFDTSNVKNMNSMFEGCSSMRSLNVSSFDTSNVIDMLQMFRDMTSLELLDLKNFDTSNITDTSWMFMGCSNLEYLDVTSFDTKNVTDMSAMFWGCKKLKSLDVSNFETCNVTSFSTMFGECSSLKEIDVSNFDTQKTYYTDSMFLNCSELKELDISSFKTNRAIYMDKMFKNCKSLTKLDMSGLNTSNVKDMNHMFSGCSGLTELDTSELDTSAVTDMSYMFSGCSGLTELRTPKNTENVTDMSGLFSNCSRLCNIDVSHFDTSNVEDYCDMFCNCANLKEIDVSNFDTRNSRYIGGMFSDCHSLKCIDVSNFEIKDNERWAFVVTDCENLISLTVNADVMSALAKYSWNIDFRGCEMLSDIYFTGTSSEWAGIKRYWQESEVPKLKYVAVHLSDGTIEQDIYHEDETFHYIENGGFGSQESIPNSYTCDLSALFDNSYNYHHDLAKVSIRAAMAAMSTEGGTNSSNIEEMMNDLNVSNRVIHYTSPDYNSIGYAMGTRRIYHNNEKKTLIMVAIRGGGYGAEWGGNANVGSGMNHEGFDLAAKQVYVALNQYIGSLKEDEFTDGSDIVVWISGYSRGAATANLLAAKLSDDNLASGVLAEYNVTEDHISAVQNMNVHAFCFECPQNTTDSDSNSLKYANIVNVINPKDFVTYVAMNNGWDWKFRRYGKDYVLPDEANMSEYATYRRRMELAYQGSTVPEMGANQSVLAKDAAWQLANVIYYDSYAYIMQASVQALASKIMAQEMNWSKLIEGIVTLTYACYDITDIQMGPVVARFAAINNGIKYAHYPELCMAWMDSISEDVLKQKKSFWKVFVNCPVDVYVYQDKNLVGLIKNDVSQQIENGVITMMDDNGQKIIVLPGDSEYKLLCKATDNGKMTITTSCYEQAESLPASVVSYYELPLQTGVTYEAFTTTSGFTLEDASGKDIIPSVVQTGEDVKFYKVGLSVEGNGEVTGVNTYAIGEFAKVTAHPSENEKFLGWYENENFVSEEEEYRFCVKTDTNLVAKFTQNGPGSKNNKNDVSDEKVSVGSRYVIKNHTYKVTSVTKKTVTFVKTTSKSKTITIPSYVTINGTKYKVTAIAAKAMKGNKKVTKITIGNNVTSIGTSAFSGCKKLTKVTLGKGVTKIGKKAFYNCKKLKSVTIKSKKLKSIGKYAFKGIATKAKIKCPSKKYKKYKKMLVKSKIGKKVRINKG
nr:BspA family leucine-rich repeat surface protein [Lachnospiraceae bacterium]